MWLNYRWVLNRARKLRLAIRGINDIGDDGYDQSEKDSMFLRIEFGVPYFDIFRGFIRPSYVYTGLWGRHNLF